jgi:Zn-dependent M28 family amino/carboxypeptidase
MMMRPIIPLLLSASLILLGTSCQGDESASSETAAATEQEKTPVPRFERDSAVAYVAGQLAFGPRVPNSEGHRQTKDWLARKFQSFGAKVTEQPFVAEAYTGDQLQATNIIAQYNPEAKKRILLCAHWDTRPFADSPISQERKEEPILGADDGGSGVAVLLEVARQLQAQPIELGVDIVLFDAEDYGESGGSKPDTYALGSQYWSRNLHVSGAQKPKYGILLDMVGARGARFPKEYFSMQYAPRIVNKVWKLAQQLGYGNYFVDAQGGAITDDHYYVNTIANIPTIDIINRPVGTQTGFGEHWHTHNDDLDVIDKRTLRAVGQVVLAVLYGEENGDF